MAAAALRQSPSQQQLRRMPDFAASMRGPSPGLPPALGIGEQNDQRSWLDGIGRALHHLPVGPAANIIGRIQERVDTASPWTLCSVERWNFELQRLPVGVDHDVQREPVPEQPDGSCEAMRFVAPVWSIQFDSVPLPRLSTEKLVERHIESLDGKIAVHPERDERLDKAVNIRVLLDQYPVKPGHLVVLTEGVVVAILGAPYFVAHQQHRRSGRQQRQRQEVFDLAIAQPLDLPVGRDPLDTAIPAEIMVRSVTISFAVRLVVLAVERNQVVERETVVAGHKIDALLGFALLLLIDIRAPGQ